MEWLSRILREYKEQGKTPRAVPYAEARRAFLQQYVRNLANAPPLSPEVLSAIRSEAALYIGRLERAQRLEASCQTMKYVG